ncbi:hypothetical protein PFICI_11170 [Pestalotiopsis fici W106-1]|uniref:Uncharacterized protein n=1 Tax=Pestalotiopsis fici (strain W106-1 / CGMCC3.15140) TaxID=1229662 RepID=W3WWQ1_PESFW|nr:uncharacterized protein PFICI_11170 [Pestalotiopsis fici W106-1]ETS77296.1 hypothetical protein PFICI_11170 [Pestalotiopsis fici W106-1]
MCRAIQIALAPVTATSSTESQPSSNAIITDDEVVVDTLPMTLLERAIQCAIRLRLDLLLSGKYYHWVFFKPGTNFDFKTMSTNSTPNNRSYVYTKKNKSRKRQRSSDDLRVGGPIKLCIFPALYEDDSAKHLTSDCGLLFWDSFDMRQHSSVDLQGSRLISPAVVLV